MLRESSGAVCNDYADGAWWISLAELGRLQGKCAFLGVYFQIVAGGRRADGWFRVRKKSSSVSREPSGGSLRRLCGRCLRISLAELGRLQDKCAFFWSLLSDSCRGVCGHGPEAVCVCGVSNEYASADASPKPQFLARQNCPLSYKSHATVLLRLGQSRRRRVVQKVFLKGERPFREKIPIVISILFGYTVVTGEI